MNNNLTTDELSFAEMIAKRVQLRIEGGAELTDELIDQEVRAYGAFLARLRANPEARKAAANLVIAGIWREVNEQREAGNDVTFGEVARTFDVRKVLPKR